MSISILMVVDFIVLGIQYREMRAYENQELRVLDQSFGTPAVPVGVTMPKENMNVKQTNVVGDNVVNVGSAPVIPVGTYQDHKECVDLMHVNNETVDGTEGDYPACIQEQMDLISEREADETATTAQVQELKKAQSMGY